jgi:hypothetical protein
MESVESGERLEEWLNVDNEVMQAAKGGRVRYIAPLRDATNRIVGLVRWWKTERTVSLGTTVVPSCLEASIIPGSLQPSFDLQIEVIGSVPRCRKLTIRATDGGREITSTDIKAIRIVDWVEVSVSTAARDFVSVGNRRMVRLTQDPETSSRTINEIRLARAPQKITPEYLKRVAEVYRENFDDKPVVAVERAFGVSNSTAAKYVYRARKAGYLGETSPGRKHV